MPRMGAAKRPLLAVVGVVLAMSGATVIALGTAAPNLAQPPPSAGSERLLSDVSSVEPDPAPHPLPVADDSPGPPTTFPPAAETVDDPVLVSSSEPASIDIPAIGVHSEMQQVGLTAEHTLEVPAPGPFYNDAAWYEHSALPGAIGSSVIVGHVDSAADGPSVFFDLKNLRPGDEVVVTRRDGTVARFTVGAVRQYPKDDFPTELVYGATDHAALRLITCGGTFDRAQRSYRDNLVVFASVVGAHQASLPS